jgi:hypothetical protein
VRVRIIDWRGRCKKKMEPYKHDQNLGDLSREGILKVVSEMMDNGLNVAILHNDTNTTIGVDTGSFTSG